MSLNGGPWGFKVRSNTDQKELREAHPKLKKQHLKRRRKLSVEEQGRLVLQTDDCRPGQCRLEVVGDQDDLAARMGKTESYGVLRGHIGKARASTCMEEQGGRTWLSSHATLRALVGLPEDEDGRVHGPAGMLGKDVIDVVPCIVGSQPLPDTNAFLDRVAVKSWPKQETQTRISKLPAILVSVGHFASPNAKIEWRHSWSLAEILMAKDMPCWVKQAFWAFKYTLKHALVQAHPQPHRGCCYLCCRKETWSPRGRRQLGSYHIKTVFLWELEEPAAWYGDCPFRLMMRLFARLQQCLNSHGLPHYFTTDVDLFDGIEDQELELAKGCVDRIITDPIAAIICSPTQPWQLYGGSKHEHDATVENIIKTLKNMANHTNRSAMALKELLSSIDIHRQRMYEKQRKRDRAKKVQSRRKIEKLVDLIDNAITHVWYLFC